ncbi:MAG: four-carbon acid sugar kinase family protein [Proteobacteria bacterium]|nr:four-carbon acid sugar kinase family protein [Pseudomonadota bacterium]
MNAPALLFYGDDFTGATDALGTAARAGLRTLLFLGAPDARRLASAGVLDCIGIAGAARSMAPDEMRDELAPVADLARALRPRVLHYKTCSTFDSAPRVGSIGEAVRTLAPALGAAPRLAIVGGQPNLGRYCLFGNLFAAAGPQGEVFRIDRHPTMSRHPVTPMDEADLRVHLARQGLHDIALVPWTAYSEGDAALAQRAARLEADGASSVLWDVAEDAHLPVLGRHLWAQARQAPLLAVGPSSVVDAVAHAVHPDRPPVSNDVVAAQGPVFVLAGSLSPVTAAQVAAAPSFELQRLCAERLASGGSDELDRSAQQLAERLNSGQNVLACTATADGSRTTLPAGELAQAGGRLLKEVLRLAPQVRRVGIAGGDTSSLAVRALDAWALGYGGLIAPGVPMCRLHSDDARLDGLELMLKGGQMGGADVFERLVAGTRRGS